jgi:1-pyrroline-5-carboxylate dehydrogenase
MTTLAGNAGPASTRRALDVALDEARDTAHDVRMVIGSQERGSSRTEPVVTPHEHRVTLGRVHYATAADVTDAIEAATAAAAGWSRRSPEQRAEPFLRAADLLESSPWRERLVAATMLELSKTVEEAEGDAAETVAFLRANVANAAEITAVQPFSPAGVTNHVEYRPLEDSSSRSRRSTSPR